MIICPNLHLPDVAREFNEIKAATSEKAAYHIWSANNGNGIDKAPNGALSKLFNDLLRLTNGNRKEAIRLKSKIYGNSFKEWFGDWLNDPENASKVVDENGEPLIVYHGGQKGINVFLNRDENPNYEKTKHQGYWVKDRVGIYFSEYRGVAKGYASAYKKEDREVYAVFLNIRNPLKQKILNSRINTLLNLFRSKNKRKLTPDLIHRFELETTLKNYDGINHSNGTELIVFNSNQIESVTTNTIDDINNPKTQKETLFTKERFGDLLNPFSQIRGFNIIFGHPAIGKTTALQGKYKDRFIDWDVEYNEKRDRWIEEHTKTKKGTKEFKNARNEYLIYPENHPDYIEFLTEEWNRVKNKAKQENKILLASPHTLLKLFPNDFNYIIDVESNDFISRNVNRGGNETDSKLWKEGIDKTVSNITNIPKYTIKQGVYLSDLLDDADNAAQFKFEKDVEKFETTDDAIDRRSIALSNLHPNEKTDEQILLDAGYKKVGSFFVAPNFDKTVLNVIPKELLLLLEKANIKVLSFGRGEYSAMAGSIKINGHTIGEIKFTNNDISRIAHNILHEIGHRIYVEHLSDAQRKQADTFENPISFYVQSLINGINTSGATISEENFVEGFATYFHNKIFGKRSLSNNIESNLVDLYRVLYKDLYENSNNTSDVSKVVDENGKPSLEDMQQLLLSIRAKFLIVQLDSLFGEDISSLLASNQQVSSKDIITRLLLKDTVSPTNVWLANILQKHDVPVRLVPTLDNILCKAVSDENGGTAIILNSNVINGVSNLYLSDLILHEVIHAVTVDAINNPKTQEEILFAKENKQMFELFDKLYPRESFNRLDVSGSYYILNNEKEFAAVFATDEDARNMLFVKAYLLDKAGNKTVFGRLKKFINAISKLFVNRNVFSTNVENLKKYQNDFTKYLLAKLPVKKGNITNKLLYDTIYNSINTNTLSNEQADLLYKELNFQLENFELNNSFHIDNKDINLSKPDTSEDAINKLDLLSEKIAGGLSLRLKAVMSSTLPLNQRLLIQKELNLQIALFLQGSATMYRSLITMLSLITPLLLEDCKILSKISQNNLAMNATDLQYQLHDNFGLYSNVLKNIIETLQSLSVIEELLRQSKLSVLSRDVVFGGIDNIKSIVETCKSICDKAEAALNNNIINSSKLILNDIGQETHSFTMAEYLDHLKSIGFDTAVFYKYGGMTDKVKDEGIRAIAYLVNKAINTSQREEAKKRNLIAKAINGLSITEKVLDIYEKDERGRTTQYVIRDLNYGKFLNDYNLFLKLINKDISKKYGILLEPDNFQAPDERIEGVDKNGNKTDSHQEWNDRVNEWLEIHCNRKFKAEYYKAYSKLSSDTRNEWNDLQRLVRAIREKCKDKETGYYDYSELTKEDQDLYTELNIKKRMLLSDRDYNGEMKVGDELRKARELQLLQKDLHPNKSKIRRDVEAWRNARDKVINECGGLKELEKYNRGEENNFNAEKLKQWDRFNSKSVLKQDENGDILLYKQIEQEIGNIIYEVDGDGGAQYQEVKDQINNITRIYRDFSTGDISWNNVPLHEKIRLNKLLLLQSLLRKKAIAQNKTLKNLSNERRKLFLKYTTTEYTESFNLLRKQALAEEAEDPGMYEMRMQLAYRMVFDSVTGQEEPLLLRWFTKIVARPEYEDLFMDFIPGDGWIMSDDNNDLVNTEFDDTNPEKMLPKRFDKDGNVLYDNSKEFKKIQSSESLKKLYDVTVLTIREINELYGRENASDYLLPGIIGSMVKRVHHLRNKVGAFWDYIKDQFGIGNQSVLQDEDFLQDSNRILDSIDEFGNLLVNKGLNISTNTRPDGHELNMIPRYYTLRLQDPSLLSADLGDILSTAHLAALKYKYKLDIKDKCETLSDMMERRSVMKRSLKSKFKLLEIKGSLSNTYKISKKFLQMNLYNIRSGDTTFEMPWFGNKKIPIHLNKLGKLLGTTTVLVNLGCNFIVAATGFFSALFSHTVQAITGQQYSGKEGVKAARLVTYHIFKNILGANYIANRLSNDKLMLITEYFNIADQGERKLKHSNRNRFINGIADNVYFGMLSGFDFLIKSQIAVSTLLSFHYYDGEFCSFEDMIINTKDMSSKERKQAFKEWKKSINVYDILSAHDNSLEIDKEYLDAYNNVENVIHNRIIKYAESADGMMTETQKALITTTFLGQMALLHRQYFPIMLQERFGSTVYDLDTQLVSGGIFRSAMKGMWYLTKALSKFLYGSAANMSVRQGYNYAKEYYDSKFNDKSSTANYIMSQTMKYQLKQVVAELALGLVVTFIAAYINNLAENERDKKKKMFLYLMSYLAHRVQWEVLTPYRFTDAFNTVKSPSAATGTIDKIENINESFWRTYFPTVYGNLYDTFNSLKKLNKYNPVVRTGVYTGWLKFQRDMFKFTPFHNTFEQLFGSDAKDRYYVNEVMKLNN